MEHTREPPQAVSFDPLLPAVVAARVEAGGVRKASVDTLTLLVLSVLGGAFIAFGAIFATTVSAGGISVAASSSAVQFSAELPYGITKLLAGLAFCVGLILVLVGAAGVFT